MVVVDDIILVGLLRVIMMMYCGLLIGVKFIMLV